MNIELQRELTISELEAENKALNDNMRSTQERCTELLLETRAQREQLAKYRKIVKGALDAFVAGTDADKFKAQRDLALVLSQE